MARAKPLRNSLIAVLLAAFPGAWPATALAQTPFSNVSPTGARVGTDEVDGDDLHIGIRIDGGYSTASMPVREGLTDSTRMRSETRRTAVMAGSVSIRKLEVFLSSIAWDSQVGSLSGTVPISRTTVREGGLYKQWGDVAVGLRKNGIPLGSGNDWKLAVEAGAQFYGKNASTAQKNGCCPGISGDATSLFTRGHLGWNAGGKFAAAVTAGLLYDRTSYIWEELKNDLSATRTGENTNPYPEERRAFGIYGNKGMLRILGGGGLDYEISDVVGVFGETTVELNASEVALRLTPGVRVKPLQQTNAAFLLYADVNPVGTTRKLSPAEPPLRVNVGMAYTFGEPAKRTPRRVVSGGAGDARKTASRMATLLIVDEKGNAIANAEVKIGDATKRTGTDGRVTFDPTLISGGKNTPVRVTNGPLSLGYQVTLGAGETKLQAHGAGNHSAVQYTFTDDVGGPLRSGTRIKVTVTPQRGALSYPNQPPEYEVGFEKMKPIMLSASESWQVRAQIVDREDTSVFLTETPATLQPPRQVLARTAPLAVRPVVGAVVEIPRFVPQNIPGVFEADLAQVRPAEVKKVAAALRAGGRKLTVMMKTGGDPVFMQVILKARCEQLITALKTEAATVPVSIPECASGQGAADEVVVE